MAVETEKKFLLPRLPDEVQTSDPTFIRQGYISNTKEHVVRVRVFGPKGFITVKGPTVNASRNEFEYEIPLTDANQMLTLFCVPFIIEKKRYHYTFKGSNWEIDQFLGDNDGLIVAEIELDTQDQPFKKPEWLEREVTDDPRFFNSNLIQHPYKNW